jgi:hypothetical protein
MRKVLHSGYAEVGEGARSEGERKSVCVRERNAGFQELPGRTISIRCLSTCMMFTCNIGKTLNSSFPDKPGAR